MGIFVPILLMLIAFSAYDCLRSPKKSLSSPNYLDIPVCQTIKGFFVILIFFSHFNSYVHYDAPLDLPLLYFCDFWGQLIVAPFFFYSGYGVYESIKKKGTNYINSFPKKRILKTLLHFDFALVLFFALNYILGIHHSPKTILLSLIAWNDIGNSNWFIFAILSTYVFTYTSFKFKTKHHHSILFVFILTLFYMAALYWLRKDEPWWYNTIICYPIGMAYSLLKNSTEKKILYRPKIFVPLSIFILAGFIFWSNSTIYSSTVSFQFRVLFFVALLIVWTRIFPLHNSILNWFGDHVFEIYILQRIPMIFFKHLNLCSSLYLYFIICALSTIILGLVFKRATKFFDSKLKM